jgi:transcriptional regulator
MRGFIQYVRNILKNTGTLHKNVSLVEKSHRTSIERSFCACFFFQFLVPTSDEVQVHIWTSWSILVLVKLALIHCSNEVIGLG